MWAEQDDGTSGAGKSGTVNTAANRPGGVINQEFYRNLAKALNGEEEPVVTSAQILRLMRVMDLLFESARCGVILDTDI